MDEKYNFLIGSYNGWIFLDFHYKVVMDEEISDFCQGQ